MHWFFHSRAKKFDERAVFSLIIESGVRNQ